MELNIHYKEGSDSKAKEICKHYWQTGGNARAEPFTNKVRWLVDNFNLKNSAELRDIVENNSYVSIPGITCIDCKKEIPATTRTKVKTLLCKGSHACEKCAEKRTIKIRETQVAENAAIDTLPLDRSQESIIKGWRLTQDKNKPSVFSIDEYQKALIVIVHNSLSGSRGAGLAYIEKESNPSMSPSLFTDRQILKELINKNILLYRPDSPYQEIKINTPIGQVDPIAMKFDLAFTKTQVDNMENHLRDMQFVSNLISNEQYLQKALDLQAEMVIAAYLSFLATYGLGAVYESEIRRLAREFVVQFPPRIIVNIIGNTIHSHLKDIKKINTKLEKDLTSGAFYNEVHYNLSELTDDEGCFEFSNADYDISNQFSSKASTILFDNIYGISNAGYNYTCSDLIRHKIMRLNKEREIKNLASLYKSI